MASFRAVLIEKDAAGGQSVGFTRIDETAMMPGDVTIAVERSTINYKDGLAVTGRLPVVRHFPMIPGVDGVGTVIGSESEAFAVGDRVLLNGWGVGELHWGFWAERARVRSEWLIALPPGITGDEAMALGTAGYTAMLAVMALERHEIHPGSGPILVTGAAGGLGSTAVSLLSSLGHHVVAATGRPEEADYLKGLGAAEVIDRAELSGPPRPLSKIRFVGAIDAVGGATLANVLSMIRDFGAVAACGNAGGMDLPGSVAPFILRGVTLYGIESVRAPKAVRTAAWNRLARDMDRAKLAAMTRAIPFDAVLDEARAIVDGRVRGRIVVEIG
ncbi:MDR family oxidoreductase [Prosthecomicrobium pneumaticum]|uniref:Acrylyl-CoA reductase (NADPH) n=1 Tax=Prosthecomicrobium pneumaticum TaxID=81895 RepID=A0A7W9CUK6_9HYPH|nr:MDR family oxidoreductase [Prosthecomicrobium pneumaticum]MBB5751954.1 acrylyl-CoA reductase (NADPH) [Prosthecomicrobium pneumaticum]